MAFSGGRGGIRTLGTSFPARSFSKRLVSASHPLFQIKAGKIYNMNFFINLIKFIDDYISIFLRSKNG